MVLLLSLFAVIGLSCGCGRNSATGADEPANHKPTESVPNDTSRPPSCAPGKTEGTLWCDNGIIRVRTSAAGITWFDVYHPREARWFVSKNNLNHNVLVDGAGWQSSEIHDVTQKGEIVSQTNDTVVAQHHFDFPHGAKIYATMTLAAGSSYAQFELHRKEGSAPISGFQWHITFGQAEAVSSLQFDGRRFSAGGLPAPLKGGPLQVQHQRWFNNLKDLNFHFSGEATSAPDPANPAWMTRVLGLKQHVIWQTPMRDQDLFAFEARDVPWQPHWGTPATTPWFEGLWFVRQDTMIEGDTLLYGFDNPEDYQ